jgi:type IV pilus assembly protein PilM
MAKQPVGVWGIDLGQCGLKAIRLTEQDGVIAATAFDFVEHPKILSQPDADPDQLTREALEKFLSRNQLKGDIVAISVPGQSGLARFVKLPPVEEKKIGDIVRFEAKQQIPFNLDEVVWDYQKLNSGVVTDGFAMETEIGLFAMKRDMVNRYLQHFKDVSVDVHVVQMAPLALCNFVAYDLLKVAPGAEETPGKKSVVVALDIGTDASNLVVTDGGRIIWQRPIPLGGNHFTRALTKDMKLTFAKAEHLKRNAIKSPDLKKILASIKPVLNDFVGEVQRSLGYFTNTHRDVQIEYMIGLGNAFRLPGLQRYLAEKLSLDVRKLEKMGQLQGDSVVGSPVFGENILSFAVAYGLAVQGLKKSKLQTNLLPQEIRTERLIKGKKPWAVAAAAALLLAIGGVTLAFGMEWNSFGGKAVTKAKDDGDKVLKALAAANRKFDEAKAEAEKEEKNIGSIVSGQKEQMNWLKLMQFIDSVVPRPEDAGNKEFQDFLLAKGKDVDEPTHQLRLKWLQEGFEVFRPWSTWRAGNATRAQASAKTAPSTDELGPGIDQLIQFNIEAVSCRYSPNLSAYWKKVLEKVSEGDRKNFIRPLEDITKPPAENEKGWVIELRGYTFHEGRTRFVIDALLERIAREGIGMAKKQPGWPLAAGSTKPAEEEATKPAPGTAPQGQPGQEGEDKLAGRPISHVVLYQASTLPADDASNFEVIGTTKLDTVIGGSGPGVRPGPGTGTGPGGPAPASGPVTPPPPGGKGMVPPSGTPGGAVPGRGGAQTEGGKPLTSEQVGGGAARTSGDKANPRHRRTEFVILFIWREPSPSEELLTKKQAPEGEQGQQSGMQPGTQGSGSGSYQSPTPGR